MSEYARLRLLLEADDYASYVNPVQHSCSVDLTPDETHIRVAVEAPGSGSGADTIYLSHMDTITSLVVVHGDTGATAAADVTLTLDTAAGSITVVVPATGVPFVCPDVDPGTDMTIVSTSTNAQRVLISYTGT